MKKYFLYITFVFALGLNLSSCGDWLDRNPSDILTDDQVWTDNKMVEGVLANYYSRIPQVTSLSNIEQVISVESTKKNNKYTQWVHHSVFDDAMWSGSKNYDQQSRNTFLGYPYDWFQLWDYEFIRDLNLAIKKCDEAQIADEYIKIYKAEFRFIRAHVYFELVKRMGGVPIITEVYTYPGNTLEEMSHARNKEYEVYEFIRDEIDEIKEDLDIKDSKYGVQNSQTRANKYTALALQSRAMLYAASLAKYNSAMPTPITMQGDYVGIPASKATEYYTKSLDAAEEIITDGAFRIQMGDNSADNFYNSICNKSNNPEVIFARDYSTSYFHLFTFDNTLRSQREDNLGGASITPTLNLVETYQYLDGSNGKLKDKDAGGNYIFYTDIADIFANKDVRMEGTVVYPGGRFNGKDVEIQAGVFKWNGSQYVKLEGNVLGSKYEIKDSNGNIIEGDSKLWVGMDGPLTAEENISNSGFYLRKYISTKAGSSTRGQGSDTWWVYFRMGEVYLNAAEAAFELGQTGIALGYINTVRERAGFGANSLSSLTLDDFIRERRCELAFEDHRYWDVKRWRIADKIWNGSQTSETAMLYGLWPYRVSGGPQDGKYILDRVVPPRFEQPRWFRIGNYYSSIEQEILNRNPKLVQNPNF